MITLLKKAFLLIALVYAGTAAAQTPADGMSAMQLENWDKAISVYSALTKANPADQDAWLSLGNAYLAKGDKAKAQEAFQTAFNAKPEGALAYVANGRMLMLQNKTAEADAQFAKAKKAAKKDMTAHRQIGESYIFFIPQGSQRPNLTRAIESLKSALEVNSRDLPTLMALGYAYKELPDGGLAAQQYELATALDPKNPLPMFMLGKVYRLAKLTDRFIDNTNRALQLNPKYTPALRSLAEYYYFFAKPPQYDKARDAYRNLVNNGVDVTIEDEMMLANAMFLSKDYPGTVTLVEKIIQKDGSMNYLRRLLGYSYFEQGDYPKAKATLDEYFKVVAPDKIIPMDYLYQGKIALNSLDTAGAIAGFRKVMELDSSKWDLNLNIYELYYAQKNTCAAAAALQTYLDSMGTEAKPLDFYKLGIAYYYCKDDSLRYQKAEQAFTKVTQMNAKAGVGWFWLGKSQARQDPDPNLFEAQPELLGQFGKARAAFEKYVEVAGVDTVKNRAELIEAYVYLIYHDFLRNDRASFDKYVAKLLEIDPTNEYGVGLKANFGAGAKAAPAPIGGGGKGKGKGKG
jgi:tetratricopeptide (TPR) repeat protein